MYKDRLKKCLAANRARSSASVFPYVSPANAYLEGITVQPQYVLAECLRAAALPYLRSTSLSQWVCNDAFLELVEGFWQCTSVSSCSGFTKAYAASNDASPLLCPVTELNNTH